MLDKKNKRPQADRLIFGGSFDPPHHGHIEMVRYVFSQNLVNHVDLIPASISPFKQNMPPLAASKHRLAMLTMVADFLYEQEAPRIEKKSLQVLDIELCRKPPSYTVNTCEHLSQKYNGQSIAILIGGDSLNGLHRWHRIGDILRHHPFWVFGRGSTAQKDRQDFDRLYSELLSTFPFANLHLLADTPSVDCASSDLRRSLRQKKYHQYNHHEYKHCLPPQILDYICKQQLY